MKLTFKPVLLRWQLQSLRLVTAVAVPVAAFWTLLYSTPLTQTVWPIFFAIFHSVAITACLGRFRSAEFAFLHSRAYSRETLWAHTWLASIIAVLAAWLPAALIVWTHARSALQSKMPPLHTLIPPTPETGVPWLWLGWYALMLPALHYAWIRHQQPTKSPNDGLWLAISYLMALLITLGRLNPFERTIHPALWVAAAAFPAVSLALLAAGRRLYHEMEVRR